jgi:arginase
MDQRIVSPYFLDREVPELRGLASPGDPVLAASFGAGDQTARVGPLHGQLAGHVAAAAQAGRRPVCIFGDCCQVIPVLAGLQRAGISPTLVWLDAHGDFNTPATTPSNFLGGMPLAMITGRGDLRMNANVGLETLPDESVVLCDGRDLDPGERELVEESAIRHVTPATRLTAQDLPDGPLYVHFDSDIIDCREAPAFHYPVPGGPSAAETAELLARLAATGRVVAASMTAWAPSLDRDGATKAKCLQAFAALLD